MNFITLFILMVLGGSCIQVGIKYENFQKRRSYYKRYVRSAINYKKQEFSYVFTSIVILGLAIFFIFNS